MDSRQWQEPVLSERFTSGLVSIIIPTRNREALLPATISSVRAQDYIDWEIVLVDDGSTDDTEALVRGLVPPERLQYIRGQGLGAQGARNLGMAHCHGEFLQFLDSDDLLHHRKLSLQVAHLQTDLSLDFSISSVIWTDHPESKPTGPKVAAPRPPLTVENLRGAFCLTPAPLFRRAPLRNVGRWDEDLAFCHETNFYGRALAHGLHSRYQPDAIAYARTHPGRLCNDLTRLAALQNTIVAFERVRLVAESMGRAVHSQMLWTIHNERANIAVVRRDKITALRELRAALPYHSDEYGGPRRRLRMRQLLIKTLGIGFYRAWWLRNRAR
jgi:glycosyltransferase involved in cell wall biosynthesis